MDKINKNNVKWLKIKSIGIGVNGNVLRLCYIGSKNSMPLHLHLQKLRSFYFKSYTLFKLLFFNF